MLQLAFTASSGNPKSVRWNGCESGRRNDAIAVTILALTVASCTTSGEKTPEPDLSSVALVKSVVTGHADPNKSRSRMVGLIVSVDNQKIQSTRGRFIEIKPGPRSLQITNIGPEKEYRGSDLTKDAGLLVVTGLANAVPGGGWLPENLGPRTLLSCSTMRFVARAGRTYQVTRGANGKNLYLKDTISDRIIATAGVPAKYAGQIAGGSYTKNIFADNLAHIHAVCPQLSSVSDRRYRKMSCSRLARELNSEGNMPSERARIEAVRRAVILNKCKPADQG